MQPATPVSPNLITCAQCGGELHPDEGQMFITCPYCAATVYLDKSRVVFHWYLAPTLNEQEARASLARWMAGNQTVKDLDKKSTISAVKFEYFPVWYFKKKKENGREVETLVPAAATSVSELRTLRLPAGDLRKYDPALDAQCQEPTVPLETALNWSNPEEAPETTSPSETVEMSLTHIPLYTFKYQYQGRTYTALVEAGTGATLANIFPAKSEAPYQMAGIASALVFLCLAALPVIGAASGDETGLGIGAGICIGVGIIAAPVLFALAAWVAAKV